MDAAAAKAAILATINQAGFRDSKTVAVYGKETCWADSGERLLLHRVADEIRGRAVLDVGVGSGRTAWLLRLLTTDYTAIDYSPEMVAACLREYPGLNVRQGDARNLSMFRDSSFKMVLFSFNGLDSLNHEERLRALAEFHRILEPSGVLLYSTTNKAGPYYGRRPWQFRQLRHTAWSANSRPRFQALQRLTVPFPLIWRSYRNWRYRRPSTEDRTGWGISVHHSHEFSFLAHFTLPSTEGGILASLGFDVEELLDRDGGKVVDDSTTTPWFYVLARKTPRERVEPTYG